MTYEEVPRYSWEGLKQQRSFSFDYYIGRGTMQFEVAGQGKVVLPDAMRFAGTWKLGAEERSLDLAVAGDYQLEKEGREWIPHPKSEEAKILEQVERILGKALSRKKGKGFTLVEDAGKTITYSFKPNLAYLDPAFEKKFTGELIVDGRSLLLREIHALSDDEDIRFDFAVSAVNRTRNIRIPFSENFLLSYSLEHGSYSKAKATLRKRLKDLGRQSKIKIENGDVVASLTLPVEGTIAGMLGKSGKLVILGLNLEGDEPEINTKGQITDIFHIADTAAFPRVRSTRLAFDSLSRPLLEVELARAEPSSRSYDYLGVAIDGVLYEVLKVDNPTNIIRIANVKTYEEVLGLSIKLERPFKGELRFLDETKTR